MADALVAHLGERVVEQAALPFAADHRCVQPPLVRPRPSGPPPAAGRPRSSAWRPLTVMSPRGSTWTASRTSPRVSAVIRISPGCGGLLEARRHVHRVAGDHALTGRPVPGNHLAGRDPGPPGQRRVAAGIRGQGLSDLGRGANRAEGVVLVDPRDAEHGHGRVADELLQYPAVPLHDGPHRVERAGQQPAQRLRIELLPQRRGTDQVAEQDRDRLAGLGQGGRGRLEWRATPVAEARARQGSRPRRLAHGTVAVTRGSGRKARDRARPGGQASAPDRAGPWNRRGAATRTCR